MNHTPHNLYATYFMLCGHARYLKHLPGSQKMVGVDNLLHPSRSNRKLWCLLELNWGRISLPPSRTSALLFCFVVFFALQFRLWLEEVRWRSRKFNITFLERPICSAMPLIEKMFFHRAVLFLFTSSVSTFPQGMSAALRASLWPELYPIVLQAVFSYQPLLFRIVSQFNSCATVDRNIFPV